MVLKPVKIKHDKNYYLKHIRNAKLDLEELSAKEKVKTNKEIVKLQAKLNKIIK